MLGWPLMDPAASLLVSFLIAKEGTASSIPAHARTRARTQARTQTQPRGRAQHTTCKRRTRSGKRRWAWRAGLVLGLASVRELSDEGLTRAELADVNQTALEVCGVTHARQGGLRHYSR
jgi:hypothetical protein